MKLLVTVLEDPDDVEVILELFYERGIPGATVVESSGMGHMIGHRHSIFSRLSDVSGSASSTHHNRTMFVVVETDETLNKAIAAVKEVVGDLNRPDSGIIFTIPVADVEGVNTPLDDSR